MIYRRVVIGDPLYSPSNNNKPKKIKKEDITLTHLLSDNRNNKYYSVTFIINSSINKIEKESLKQAILNNISSYDRQYMELNSFTRKKAIFHLRTKKFIDDTLRNVKPTTVLTNFSKVYRLKKRWPDMITYDIMKDSFVDFLLYHFKDYINKKGRGLLKFFNVKARGRLSNLFDYTYDYNFNYITVSLKTVYKASLLFGLRNSFNKRGTKPFDFNRSVNRRVSNFNKNKWRRFVKKSFI